MNTTLPGHLLPWPKTDHDSVTVNEEILQKYGIGEKIRSLRKNKKMGLVELGRHSGLSAALLSKIETGKLIPPLPTLLRIAMVFSVGLDYFFTDNGSKHLVSVARNGRDSSGELAGSGHSRVNAAIFRIDANITQLSALDSGTALLYVLDGQVRAAVGEDTWTVDQGDCVTFSLHLPHTFSSAGAGARALFLTVS